MKRLLLDVNVVLDVLLARSPHVAGASAVWAQVELGRAEGFVPAHGITTIYYLARRSRDRGFAHRAVSDLLSVFRVAVVDDQVIRGALALRWPDFEDAVCAVSAQSARCGVLVTRDPDGYPGCAVPLLDPASAAAWIRG